MTGTLLSLGLLHFVMSFEENTSTLPMSGLGLLYSGLVVATFRSWWFHYLICMANTAAIYFIWNRRRLEPGRARRGAAVYLGVVLAMAMAHIGAVGMAWNVGIFRTPSATYVVDHSGPLRTAALVNAVLLLPAVMVFVGTWCCMPPRGAGCRQCGYDLAGLPASAGRCPECGEAHSA